MDTPVGFFQKEVFDMTDLAIGRVNMMTGHRRDAAQMRIAIIQPCIGDFPLALAGAQGL